MVGVGAGGGVGAGVAATVVGGGEGLAGGGSSVPHWGQRVTIPAMRAASFFMGSSSVRIRRSHRGPLPDTDSPQSVLFCHRMPPSVHRWANRSRPKRPVSMAPRRCRRRRSWDVRSPRRC
jgi:hypothetical protein